MNLVSYPPEQTSPAALRAAEGLGTREKMMSSEERLEASIQQMTKVVEANSITLAEVAWQAKAISQEMSSLAARGAQVSTSSKSLAENASKVSSGASYVAELAQQAQKNSHEGQQALSSAIDGMRQMGQRAEGVTTMILGLQESSHRIEHIVQLIREIAEKINLLSLNASIEAARAGVHGKGFAVVAAEVSKLAAKTHEATQEIDTGVSGILKQTELASSSVSVLLKDVQGNVGQIEQVGEKLNGILDFSGVLSGQMQGIVSASQASTQQVLKISDYLAEIQKELSNFGQRIHTQEDQVMALTELGEGFFDRLVELDVDTTHSDFYKVARAAADQVGQAFEAAIDSGQVSSHDIFSLEYRPIPNTNPPKFNSRFDGFTDRVLPAIQERVLRDHPRIIFAITTDKSGYVPTHNDKFAKPMTGNYDVDLVQSRTKRIFSDRTGSRCGSHTKKMLLQTYKRDTGEIMHDLSVPIYVRGQHWGGFRMGYRAD